MRLRVVAIEFDMVGIAFITVMFVLVSVTKYGKRYYWRCSKDSKPS